MTLEEAMEKKGLTGKELAKRIGVSETQLSHWRTGSYIGQEDRLQRLANALGMALIFRPGGEHWELMETGERVKKLRMCVICGESLEGMPTRVRICRKCREFEAAEKERRRQRRQWERDAKQAESLEDFLRRTGGGTDYGKARAREEGRL